MEGAARPPSTRAEDARGEGCTGGRDRVRAAVTERDGKGVTGGPRVAGMGHPDRPKDGLPWGLPPPSIRPLPPVTPGEGASLPSASFWQNPANLDFSKVR